MRLVNDTYDVIFDTNAIKGKYWIDQKIRANTASVQNEIIFSTNLYLPEVVKREWQRYYAINANAHHDAIRIATKQLGFMNIRTAKQPEFDLEKTNRKSQKILKDLGFKFIPTPHDKIDFKNLIELALTKKPPFVPLDDTDKGFKDAVIAHTAVEHAKRHPSRKAVFITSDKLLTAYLKNITSELPNFKIFKEFKDFIEEMKLKNNALSKDLTNKASEAFFVEDSKTGFYYEMGVNATLKKDYATKFSDLAEIKKHLDDVELEGSRITVVSSSTGSWKKASSQLFISDSSFKSKTANKIIWNTDIDLVQRYAVTLPSSDPVVDDSKYHVDHITLYQLEWSTLLDGRKKLTQPELISVNFVSESKKVSAVASSSALRNLLGINLERAQQSVSLASSFASSLAIPDTSPITSQILESIKVPDMSWITQKFATPSLLESISAATNEATRLSSIVSGITSNMPDTSWVSDALASKTLTGITGTIATSKPLVSSLNLTSSPISTIISGSNSTNLTSKTSRPLDIILAKEPSSKKQNPDI